MKLYLFYETRRNSYMMQKNNFESMDVKFKTDVQKGPENMKWSKVEKYEVEYFKTGTPKIGLLASKMQ
jgi:hypothetical protein